jgi:hypothetical protein
MTYKVIYGVHQSVCKGKSEYHNYTVHAALHALPSPHGHFVGDVLGFFNRSDIFHHYIVVFVTEDITLYSNMEWINIYYI